MACIRNTVLLSMRSLETDVLVVQENQKVYHAALNYVSPSEFRKRSLCNSNHRVRDRGISLNKILTGRQIWFLSLCRVGPAKYKGYDDLIAIL